jgi:cobalamin biosynthetic protein CobC
MLDDPHTFPRHGGALALAATRYGIPVSDWLDLSTGINPHPYPLSAPTAAQVNRLPDPAALASLLDVARDVYGVSRESAIAATPGSDIALRLLPLLAPEGRVAILGPTYSGHAEAWSAAGRTVDIVPSIEDLLPSSRIVIVVNPNNPDGRIVDPEALRAVAHRLRAVNGLLVIDEAFGDVAPGTSLAPACGDAPVVILRSFGKFYGLAGLRLGFALGDPGIVNRLARLLGDWPVSGVAIDAGCRALGDAEWQAAARLRLQAARRRLDDLLDAAGLTRLGGTDLFVLAEASDAAGLHESLARQGILTRAFEDQPGRIRFGLPADDAFDRLAAALARA